MDRQMLYRRIDRRVDSMIEAGLEDEVKKLFDMGYSANLKSMQSIGYRHMADFVERRLSRDECIRTLKRDTRRFAKRQFTWFGADKEIIWLRPDQSKRIHKLVNEFAGKNSNAK
jgi:tRNA dimethylallyltransferase